MNECNVFFCFILFALQLGGYEQVEDAYLGVLTRTQEFEKTRDKAGLVRSMAGFFMQLGLLKGARLVLSHDDYLLIGKKLYHFWANERLCMKYNS